MMLKPPSAVVILGFVGVSLVACSDATVVDQVVVQTEERQLQANFDCQYELGLDAPEAIQSVPLKDGRVVVSTVNAAGLSRAQARAVNQCAQAKLLNPATVYHTAVDVIPSPQSLQVQQSVVRKLDLPGCRKGAGVMQGGVGICPGY